MRYAMCLWVSLLGASAAMAAPGVKLQRQVDPSGGQPTTTVGQKVKLQRTCPYRVAGEPRYRSSKPLYGVARLGTGAHNTHVFAVDESGGTGKGYDTVTLDANNNRDLSDDKAMPLRRYGQTQAVPVSVELDGHPITLHVTAEIDETTCSLHVLDYCRGKASIGGKMRSITLVDYNGNGVLNDLSEGEDFLDGKVGDVLLVDMDGDGKFSEDYPFPKEYFPWGRHALIGGQYYALAAPRDGSTLSLTPTRLPLAPVRCPYSRFALLIAGPMGSFQVQGRNGTVKLPVGSYTVSQWHVEQPDRQGRHWGIEAVDWRQSRLQAPRLSVQNGTGGTFNPGLPLVARAQRDPSEGGNSFDLKLATASGAPVASLAVDGKRAPAPTLKVLNAAGRQVASQSFEYG